MNKSNLIHERAVKFITEELVRLKGQTNVVVTHHSPSFQLTDPKYGTGSKIESGFTTNLEHLFDFDFECWFFGHTHYLVDKIINEKRFINNCVGYLDYPHMSMHYKNKTIEIGE